MSEHNEHLLTWAPEPEPTRKTCHSSRIAMPTSCPNDKASARTPERRTPERSTLERSIPATVCSSVRVTALTIGPAAHDHIILACVTCMCDMLGPYSHRRTRSCHRGSGPSTVSNSNYGAFCSGVGSGSTHLKGRVTADAWSQTRWPGSHAMPPAGVLCGGLPLQPVWTRLSLGHPPTSPMPT